MNKEYTKWVACWGNATSISDQKEATFTKNITFRYPIQMCFSGSKLRFHFSNLTGTEDVTISYATVARKDTDGKNGKRINPSTIAKITFDASHSTIIPCGEEIISDEIPYDVSCGETLCISLYFENYTQLNSGVLITGPLSKGYYSYGNFSKSEYLDDNVTRNTNWFYFLNTIDVLTEEKNHALICYGDSITAQSWPDYLSLRASRLGYHNVSIIRRAVSGTRILREYDCITYAAYGLKGATRFPIEMNVAGADTVLIQHGINDIIHPVGTDINRFRPWSDMPTCEDLIEGFSSIYINYARELGLKVWGGTLLPIYGWRTYEQFREDIRCEFNDWLINTDLLDGCVDFSSAVCAPEMPEKFADGYDSGDHLHPSELAYEMMAEVIPEELLI